MRAIFLHFAAILIVGMATSLAAPFQINSATDIKADFSIAWSSYSSTNGATVPDNQTFAASDVGPGGATVSVTRLLDGSTAPSLTIRNSGGVLLQDNGQARILIRTGRSVQGFGMTISHSASVNATYTMVVRTVSGGYIGTVSAPSPGSQGNPVFLGMIDPDSRIGMIEISATPGNTFAITSPVFQLAVVGQADPTTLPATAQKTLNVSNTATYLHQGLSGGDPATLTAIPDNENAFDLLAIFPSLKTGDFIRYERLGYSGVAGNINNLVGVLSKTLTITAGTDFNRVPGAIQAGTNFYTAPVQTGNFSTSTNIPQDFIIGQSTFISHPASARYLFLSLATPSPGAAPLQVRLSLIPRLVFLDWLASFGLVGSHADPSDDLDHDGLTLLEEFAYGKDPTFSDAGGQDDFSFSPQPVFYQGFGEQLFLAFGARYAGPLRYTAEFTSDLKTWEPVGESQILTIFIDSTDSSRAVFAAPDPHPTGKQRFGRVRIEYVPPVSN